MTEKGIEGVQVEIGRMIHKHLSSSICNDDAASVPNDDEVGELYDLNNEMDAIVNDDCPLASMPTNEEVKI